MDEGSRVIFGEQKSALARLSDAVKTSLQLAALESRSFLDVVEPYDEPYQRCRAIARTVDEAEDLEAVKNVEAEALEALKQIPESVLQEQLPRIHGAIHVHSLTTILLSCFTIESYINSFAYFFFREKDLLGLIRGGHETSADMLFEAFDRLSTPEKWLKAGKLARKQTFNTGSSPFQDLKILFKCRNDHAHDKVVEMTDDRAKDYNYKLPDPVFGFLDLTHALYAASTYWKLVESP